MEEYGSEYDGEYDGSAFAQTASGQRLSEASPCPLACSCPRRIEGGVWTGLSSNSTGVYRVKCIILSKCPYKYTRNYLHNCFVLVNREVNRTRTGSRSGGCNGRILSTYIQVKCLLLQYVCISWQLVCILVLRVRVGGGVSWRVCKKLKTCYLFHQELEQALYAGTTTAILISYPVHVLPLVHLVLEIGMEFWR